MELHEMIYSRLRNDSTIESLTARYNGGAAVFYQRAPSADNGKWESNIQFPRIDYTLDMMENPARNTSGVLMCNICCDTQVGAEPEDIESRVRALLHATFAQTDDYAYVFAWVRSDSFQIERQTDNEKTARTIGVTVIFDVMACPCQQTMFPDPIKAMNAWTKTVLPNAVVIGVDTIEGWLEPTRAHPIIYWHVAASGIKERHPAYTTMQVTMEGHVYAKTSADRLHNLAHLTTAQAIARYIPMEDTSPLTITGYLFKPHFTYISQGQLQVTGTYGILQPPSAFSKKSTGQKLNHVFFDQKEGKTV